MENSFLVLDSTKDGWKVHEHFKNQNPCDIAGGMTVAFDPNNSDRAYCGTFDNGLWKSDDNGLTWEKTSLNVPGGFNIMSLAVSHQTEKEERFSKLFVGMEPSLIFSSVDGGQNWENIDQFNRLPSSSSWSFPPRPWTHHVRVIEPDINKKEYLFAAIEAGALIKSLDGGKTWIDRVENGPYDTHTLITHRKAPGRLYSAAGDGYFESQDYGNSWKRLVEGLGQHTYMWSIAVDSDNPQNRIVSSSSNAFKAHYRDPESFVYRCLSDSYDDRERRRWALANNGL